MLTAWVAMTAQTDSLRRITPVRPETNTTLTPPKGTPEEIIKQYLTGDTASAKAQERKDSLAKIYPHYPLLTDVTIGVNILDPLLMAFGQTYGNFEVSGTLNMWNRLQGVLELGMGRAKSSPDDKNYSYVGKLSPFARIGVNYNLLFKKTPDYQAILGLRLGYTTFKYDINDIVISDPYWRDEIIKDIKGEKSHALWGEFGVGLRIKLFKNVSAGWQLKYKWLFSYKKNENSEPWFVPGYGARGKSLSATLSIYYTIPLSKDKWPAQQTKETPARVTSKSSVVMD